MSRRLPLNAPSLRVSEKGLEKEVAGAINGLLKLLRRMQIELVGVVNFNSLEHISQNDQPTLDVGKAVVWHDADAAVGQPTHYILVNVAGTTVRFPSQETA